MRPGAGIGIAKSLLQDRSVLKETVRPGTWRRMVGLIRPCRRVLAGFLCSW